MPSLPASSGSVSARATDAGAVGPDRQMRERIARQELPVENQEARQVGVVVLQRVEPAERGHHALEIRLVGEPLSGLVHDDGVRAAHLADAGHALDRLGAGLVRHQIEAEHQVQIVLDAPDRGADLRAHDQPVAGRAWRRQRLQPRDRIEVPHQFGVPFVAAGRQHDALARRQGRAVRHPHAGHPAVLDGQAIGRAARDGSARRAPATAFTKCVTRPTPLPRMSLARRSRTRSWSQVE